MKKILLQLSRLMSVRILAIALTFLQTLAMTRALGSEIFGLLSFALSISAVLVLVLSLGVDQVLMRDIARHGLRRVTATGAWRDDWTLVRRLVTPVTLAGSAAGLGLSLGTDLFGAYATTITAAFLMLPVVMARKYVEAIVLGSKQTVRSVLGSQVVYPLLMVAGGGAILLFSIPPSTTVIGTIYVLATLGSLGLSLVLAGTVLRQLRSGPPDGGVAPDSPGRRAILISSGHFALASLGFVVGQHIDVLLTGILAAPEEVGLVRIASRVAEMAGLMRAIVVLQYRPQLAEAHARADDALLRGHVRTMTTIFVATGLPLTIGLWIFAEEVMTVFGPEFAGGAWAMRIYVLGVFFTLVCGPCTILLSMCGQERHASRTIWIGLAINVILDLVLIPVYGALGCAIANMSSMLFIGIASTSLDIRLLKIDPSVLGLRRKARKGAGP